MRRNISDKPYHYYKSEEKPKLHEDHKKHDLKVKPFKTNETKVHYRECQIHGIIPKHSAYIVGSSGSGKSTLLCSLLCEPQYYGKRKD